MTSEPNLARSVARLENDRDSLYELVDDFRTEVRHRFEKIDARIEKHGARFDRLEDSLAEVLRRLPEPL